jgi:transcriptional regulator with XRE-family HTH domain
MLGLSQHDLADVIGVTYQQLHKYERGLNRIAASRLSQVAEVLRVDVGYFFEGARAAGSPELSTRQRMLLDLARNFAAIESEGLQRAVCALVRSLAEHPERGLEP